MNAWCMPKGSISSIYSTAAGREPKPCISLCTAEGEEPSSEGTASGRGDSNSRGGGTHGVAVPPPRKDGDMARRRVANGVDGLLRLQARPQCVLQATGEAAGRAGAERELLLPGLHQDFHDSGERQPVTGGGRRGWRQARLAPSPPTTHREVLQVVHPFLVLEAVDVMRVMTFEKSFR